ncbi:PLC-like phosphodiesterase [Cunninghamella echinulata]|nr:PLC-like phosphodiesterase [Cunninghamella echinulata]
MYFNKNLLNTLLATVISAVAVSGQQQACNGYSELCSRPYHQAVTVLTHNSYANFANVAANQACAVTTQLSDGVRGLKLSAIVPSNVTLSDPTKDIHLCHTSCSILDAGPATQTLSQVADWLKNNPNEVVTIMWNTPNNNPFKVSDFKAMYQASGLLDYVYTQPANNYTWPTLQEMIASGKRLVTFTDIGADQAQLPWLLPEFNYVFETPYDNRDENSFSCTIDRPSNPANAQSMMYVMNHFIYGSLQFGSTTVELPQKGTANKTNSDSLLNQAKECSSTFGRLPTFLEVDFFNLGNTMAVTAQLNNVTYDSSKQLQCNNEATNGPGSSNGKSGAHHLTISSSLMTLFLVAALGIVYF